MEHKEIAIWRLDMALMTERLEYYRSVLSPDELERASKFHQEIHQQRFVVRRGVLRELLSRYLDIAPAAIHFQYGPFGKPSVTEVPDLHFNISHADLHSVYAFNRQTPIGVDLELVNAAINYQQVAEHFFAPEEVKTIQSLDQQLKPLGFYHCWTRKEAFIKARGDGLTYPLRNFTVTLQPGDPARVVSAEGTGPWQMEALSLWEGYVGALAYQGEELKLTFQN